MKTAAILSIASLFSSLVGAVPLEKRAYVTHVETTTVVVTTTVWIDPADVTPSPGAFYDNPAEEEVAQEEEEEAVITSSSSSVTSTSSPPPPPPPSTPTPTPAPEQEYNYEPEPEPEPEPQPQPTPTPEPTYEQEPPSPDVEADQTEPEVVEEQPPVNNYAVDAPSGGYDNTGRLTFYDPGLGSCGLTNYGSEPVVAISHLLMAKTSTGNPNTNPLCGKKIIAEYQGKVQELTVVDTCQSCTEQDIDVSPTAFEALTGNKDLGKVQCNWTME